MKILKIKKKEDTFELLDNFKEYAKKSSYCKDIYILTFKEKERKTSFESKTTIYLKDEKFYRNTTWGEFDAEGISNREISKEDASRLIWINRKYINTLFLNRP